MVWNIPVVSWGQLSQLRPIPTSCAPPGVGSRKVIDAVHEIVGNKIVSVLLILFSAQIQNTVPQLLRRKLTLSQLEPQQKETSILIALCHDKVWDVSS